VLPNDKFIQVKAVLVDKTKNQLIMRAEVTNESGKLVAVCQATQQVIKLN